MLDNDTINQEYTYILPVIKISEDNRLPLLPLYLIAALKNDHYAMNQFKNKNYEKFYSLNGVFETFGSLQVVGNLKLKEKELTPEEYSTMVLSKYAKDNLIILKKILNLVGFSKYLYLSILFLLDHNKITLDTVDDYFKLQSNEIFQIVIDNLFDFKDLDYREYMHPTETSEIIPTVKTDIFDLGKIDFKFNNSDFIQPLKIKLITKYCGLLGDKTENYDSSALYYFYEYEKEDLKLFLDDVPLIRKIDDPSSDIFGAIKNKHFYKISNFSGNVSIDQKLKYCHYAFYSKNFDTSIFSKNPEFNIINISDKANAFYIYDKTGFISNTEYQTKYIKNQENYLWALIRYNNLELLYPIDIRVFGLYLKNPYLYNHNLENADPNLVLEQFNIFCNDYFKKDNFSANLSKIYSKSTESKFIDSISVDSTYKALNHDSYISKLSNDENTKKDQYILIPNNSYIEKFDESFYIYPKFKINIQVDNAAILENMLQNTANFIDNMYKTKHENTNLYSTYGQIESFKTKTYSPDIVYFVNNMNLKYGMKLNISCEKSDFNKDIMNSNIFHISGSKTNNLVINNNWENLFRYNSDSALYSYSSDFIYSVLVNSENIFSKTNISEKKMYFYKSKYYLELEKGSEEETK